MKEKMIKGVQLTPLKQIFDERGKVMHMLSCNSSIFSKFGEIYFSCSYPGAIKAWHLHSEATLNYAVIFGQIKFVLYDTRPDSPTNGLIQEIFISPENYMLVTVPPLIWNGFVALGNENSIVANCSTIAYDTEEITRWDLDDKRIPYSWHA
jgi:dTDP-4-dehydrorhamnose 3,5-epimerase